MCTNRVRGLIHTFGYKRFFLLLGTGKHHHHGENKRNGKNEKINKRNL